MFTLKAPLVETIVAGRLPELINAFVNANPSASQNDVRQKKLQICFEQRRELWKKPLQWLVKEAGFEQYCDTVVRAAVAASSGSRGSHFPE